MNNNEKDFSVVYDFLQIKKKYDKMSKKFEQIKSDFYNQMNVLFSDNEDKKVFENETLLGSNKKIEVQKQQRVSIIWNIEKLEKKLGKKKSSSVIVKSYTINNWKGFSSYLSECGCDPNIIKSFISVEKTVNQKALDNLSDLGEIDKNDIKGCYEVKKGLPFYKVKEIE
jgi:hypothetical protein